MTQNTWLSIQLHTFEVQMSKNIEIDNFEKVSWEFRISTFNRVLNHKQMKELRQQHLSGNHSLFNGPTTGYDKYFFSSSVKIYTLFTFYYTDFSLN